MRPIKRQYLFLIPVATLFFIFGSLYSAHSWAGIPELRDGHWNNKISLGNANQPNHEQYDENKQKEDPNCADFPHDRLADVQVVLRIGSTQPFDQISSHITNITNCISNLVIISDKKEKIGEDFWSYDIIADLPKVYWEGIDNNHADETSGLRAYTSIHGAESSWEMGKHVGDQLTHREGWLLDRFKFLPMVEYAYDINPQAKWFFFVEADTYIVWDTFFRLIDRYDSEQPWYMGSPAPGRDLENGERTYFAYGGNGFILSRPAIKKLLHRDIIVDEPGNMNRTEPPLTEKWADLVKSDCCGDSVLGFALANKGIFLSGLYPLFVPHALHGIPFGPSGKPYWCQPVLSMHKTWPGDVPMLSQFLKDRQNEVGCHFFYLLS
jgi:Fringe-like